MTGEAGQPVERLFVLHRSSYLLAEAYSLDLPVELYY